MGATAMVIRRRQGGPVTVSIVIAPIAEGRVDEWRAFHTELTVTRRIEWAESQHRRGITREASLLLDGTLGTLCRLPGGGGRGRRCPRRSRYERRPVRCLAAGAIGRAPRGTRLPGATQRHQAVARGLAWLARTPVRGQAPVTRRIALVVCLALMLGACSAEGSVLGGPGCRPAPAVTIDYRGDGDHLWAGSFPPLVADAYLEGCADEPSDLDYCRCTLEEFEQRLTLDEFIALEDLSGGVVLEVANACLNEIGSGDSTAATPVEEPPLPPDNLRAYTDLTIDAVEAYWEVALPDYYGIAYEDVSATIPYFPSSGDLPGCGPEVLPGPSTRRTPSTASRATSSPGTPRSLMPGLYTEFGDFAVALVLAHEWGHAIQSRAQIGGLGIMLELQADCFAGAWAGHVDGGGSSLLALQPGDLDEAMGGYLLFRDPPGTSPGETGCAWECVRSGQRVPGRILRRTRHLSDLSRWQLRRGRHPADAGGLRDGRGSAVRRHCAAAGIDSRDVLGGGLSGPRSVATIEPMTDFGPYLPSTGCSPRAMG